MDLADGLRLLHQTGGGGYFGHAQHLQFAWGVLEDADDADEAARVISLTIRHIATLGGNPAKYHATVTIFWVRFLGRLRADHPEVRTVAEMIELHPELGDARLPDTYWSDLDTEDARTGWVEPDLRPLA